MFFLNLGLAQFLILAGAASFATLALYLFDRSRRRQVVSTLRFWTQAHQPVQTSRKRKLQQPWSLVLQLLGILLLLLAIAQPRLGNPFAKPGYHVLVLETSAWMAARGGNETLMDRARARSLQWLASLPANDPVMLVRADALATPATAFELDRQRIANAITASEPGATALNIDEAIAFARGVQSRQGVHGEVAFIGSGRIKELKDAASIDGRDLRVILIPDRIENVGLRTLNVRRSSTDPSAWEVLVAVRNYGPHQRAVNLVVGFDQAPVGTRRLSLAPGTDQETILTFHSRDAGILEARLSPEDAFPQDDRATLVIPALPTPIVIVYTLRPEFLRPFLTANPRVNAEFRSPAQYRNDDKGLVILDRFHPTNRPRGDAVYIDPPANESPIPISTSVEKLSDLRWNTATSLGTGLRARDTKIAHASVLQPSPGDIRVAEIAEGPVVIARPGSQKLVVIGFDPGAPSLRYELSMPIVFANILGWMLPEIFTQSDINVQSAGSVSASIPDDSDSSLWQVTRADGTVVPFTRDHHMLHFFSGTRENVRVVGRNRESAYALTLPEMWDIKWQPPADALRGVPRTRGFTPVQSEIWPWLASLGALCLIADWVFFSGIRNPRARAIPMRPPLRKAS